MFSKGTRRLQMERSYSPVMAVKNRAIISLVGTEVEEGDKHYYVVKGEQFLSDGHRVILFTTEITGMMLEKNDEKILKMIEDLNYLAEKVKAAVDKLNK